MAVQNYVSEAIGIILEALMYGIYVVMLHQCMTVLRAKRKHVRTRYLQWTSILLFVLCTVHLVIDIYRDFEARASGDANKYYNLFATWSDILKSVLYVAVTVISDGFLVYRCYVVWGKRYPIIVVPMMGLLADLGLGILWCYTLSTVKPGATFEDKILAVRVKVFYSITLALNLACTLLIAYKIWKIQRSVYKLGTPSGDLNRVVIIIIESGAIYSLWLVLMIGTYVGGSTMMFAFLNSVSPVIGIVFSAVIVRVGMGVSTGDRQTESTSVKQSNLHFRSGAYGANTLPGYPSQLPGDGVQITLTQTVQRDDDIELGSSGRGSSKMEGFAIADEIETPSMEYDAQNFSKAM